MLYRILVVLFVLSVFVPMAFAQEPTNFDDPRFCDSGDSFAYAVPSPDGTKLAVLHWDDNYYDDRERGVSQSGYQNYYGLFVFDLISGEMKELVGSDVHWFQPVWRGNDHIVFMMHYLATTPPRQVVTQYYNSDNELITETEIETTLRQDWIVQTDMDGNLTWLTEGFGRVAISPDGNTMAFRRRSLVDSFQIDIWLKDLEKGNETLYGYTGQQTLEAGDLTIGSPFSAYNLSYSASGELFGEAASFSMDVQTVYNISDIYNPAEVIPLESGFTTNDNVNTFTGTWKGNHDVADNGAIVYQMEARYDVPNLVGDRYNRPSSWIMLGDQPLTDGMGRWVDLNPMFVDNDTIVFISDRLSDEMLEMLATTGTAVPNFDHRMFNIWTINTDGTGLRQLTCN